MALASRGFGRCEQAGSIEEVCRQPIVPKGVAAPLSKGAWDGSGNALLLGDFVVWEATIHGQTFWGAPVYSWVHVPSSPKSTANLRNLTIEVRDDILDFKNCRKSAYFFSIFNNLGLA